MGSQLLQTEEASDWSLSREAWAELLQSRGALGSSCHKLEQGWTFLNYGRNVSVYSLG